MNLVREHNNQAIISEIKQQNYMKKFRFSVFVSQLAGIGLNIDTRKQQKTEERNLELKSEVLPRIQKRVKKFVLLF